MENTIPLFVAKAEATGSYYVRNEGFIAEKPADATPLTSHDMSILYFSLPKLSIIKEVLVSA
jgi:hypothetical protein